jgi:hypothetical protein
MTEEQAWEQLYGRRSPDVRVLGQRAAEDDEELAPRGEERRARVTARRDPESEAHAA